jgi:hypothetical protein
MCVNNICGEDRKGGYELALHIARDQQIRSSEVPRLIPDSRQA